MQLKERNGEISIFTQLKLKRTVGRCMILEPENVHTKRDNVLLKALVKAHLWKRQLEEGKYANMKELSIANNMDPKAAYVRTILSLNFFGPKDKRGYFKWLAATEFKVNGFEGEGNSTVVGGANEGFLRARVLLIFSILINKFL